jgi:hypothetical protein
LRERLEDDFTRDKRQGAIAVCQTQDSVLVETLGSIHNSVAAQRVLVRGYPTTWEAAWLRMRQESNGGTGSDVDVGQAIKKGLCAVVKAEYTTGTILTAIVPLLNLWPLFRLPSSLLGVVLERKVV